MADDFMKMGIPEKIEVHKEFQHLQIIRKWFGFKFIMLTLGTLLWGVVLVSWYTTMSSLASAFGFMFILVSLMHVAGGIGLAYYTLAGYLNRTTIEVDFHSLTIRHGPLPWWGNHHLPSRQLKQLYCKRDESWVDLYRKRYATYAVRAITNDQRSLKLLSGLDSSEQALFIEQEIEMFLKIEDKPVKGAIR